MRLWVLSFGLFLFERRCSVVLGLAVAAAALRQAVGRWLVLKRFTVFARSLPAR